MNSIQINEELIQLRNNLAKYKLSAQTAREVANLNTQLANTLAVEIVTLERKLIKLKENP